MLGRKDACLLTYQVPQTPGGASRPPATLRAWLTAGAIRSRFPKSSPALFSVFRAFPMASLAALTRYLPHTSQF